MRDPRFQANLREPDTNVPLRNEIFGVYPVRESDITTTTVACRQTACYRVEMYNYALNLSVIALVDVKAASVLAINQLNGTQPDISPELTKIAEEIAVNAPEVIAALGVKPSETAAVMASTKTALNRSRCERSGHLCVAPTFVKGEWALWAIVDLTDGVLVGVRWTAVGPEVGQNTEPLVTEKSLENAVVTKRYCETSTALARAGWQLNYILTSSDGLRIYDVRFHDQPVLDSAKLMDWHVSYSQKDGFGYSDAIGCPVFSQAAVVAFNGPSVEEIHTSVPITGFALVQNYKSEQMASPLQLLLFPALRVLHGWPLPRGLCQSRTWLRHGWQLSPGRADCLGWQSDLCRLAKWDLAALENGAMASTVRPSDPRRLSISGDRGRWWRLLYRAWARQLAMAGAGQCLCLCTRRHNGPSENDEGDSD